MRLRRTKLTTIGGLLLMALLLPRMAWAAEDAKRPNILLVITDQQHAGMMSCTGNPWLKTPALDALAARGVRFERAYATAPVCAPARFSLLTGFYPSAVGLRHNQSKPVDTESFVNRAMGHVFQAGGYRTLYGGKVHLPGAMRNIEDCGFETVLTGNARKELADRCAAFLHDEATRGNRPDKKPFLLVASFINPHDICFMALNAERRSRGLPNSPGTDSRVCEGLLDRIRNSGDVSAFVDEHCPPLPDNFELTRDEPGAIESLLATRPFRPYVRENWSEESWRMHRWVYCRLTEMVDREIGIVLDALNDSGLDDNTVVIFTSDHGDMDSAHRMEHKSAFYEEASHIPLILAEPPSNATATGRIDRTHLISNGIDILPTLCDYAQIGPPEGLRGRSIRPLVRGEATAWRQDILIENEIGRMVHTGRYKYAHYDSGSPREMLIDLESDPGEMTNLYADPEYADVLRSLRGRLGDHLKQNAAARKAVVAPPGE